jgi:ABC-2 type transport system permease protein
MKYAGLVARREYLETIKTRGFWVGVFMFPLILFLSTSVPAWLAQKATPVRYYVLVDQSGGFAPVVESSLGKYQQKKELQALNDYARQYAAPVTNGPNPLAQFISADAQAVDKLNALGGRDYYLKQLQPRLKDKAPPFKEPARLYQPVPLPEDLQPDADVPSLARDLRPYLRGEKTLNFDGHAVSLTAAILIPSNIEQTIVRPNAKPAAWSAETNGIEYWAANLTESDLRDQVTQAVNDEVRRKEFLARGMDAAAFHDVEQTYVPVVSLNPKKEAGKETVKSGDVVLQWLPSAFVYLLWVSLFGISQMLLSNTIEEKSNRIIEVLLSSVTPGELMMGKLFGIAAVGLTMISAWMFSVFVVLSAKAGSAGEIAGQILPVLKTSHLLPMFALYFLLGYLMYGALILAIGSVCNTLKEAQSYMSSLTLLMMVPLMTMTYIPKDPNGTLARVLSWIPLFTPFTMMNRAMADPPWIDMVGTLILLIASAAVALWMAGKVFRTGILRTGQPPRIVEMIKWIRRAE